MSNDAKNLIFHRNSPFQDELGLSTKESEYIEVNLENVNSYEDKFKISHCMLYASDYKTDPILEIYDRRAIIPMQLRYDGYLGFLGNYVEKGEPPEEAVNRKIIHELGIDHNAAAVDERDLCCVHYSEDKRVLLYFYVKHVSLSTINAIETKSLRGNIFGKEVLGLMRVPLYTVSDGFRGFPAFLSSPFVGNAKQQLIKGLLWTGIMEENEITTALNAKPRYVKLEND